jgi:hypothetical protein
MQVAGFYRCTQDLVRQSRFAHPAAELVTFEALITEKSPAVHLSWQVDGEYFLNSWQYNAPGVTGE